MRKYQQLLLLIVSVVCLISLLIYRHEYLKLRSVLSVLSFFGNAEGGNNSTCLVLSNDIKADVVATYLFSEPKSSWTKLDDHYFYSSFWEDSETNGGVGRTSVIGPRSSFSNYSCRIWFEEGDILVSKAGKVNFDVDRLFKSDKTDRARWKYFLKCIVDERPLRSKPYGILWITPFDERNVFAPIFHRKTRIDRKNRNVVCVRPDYSGIAKTKIIEFVSYYNTIGATDFIFYDAGIQFSVFPFLKSVAGRVGLVGSVTVLQWNYPITDTLLEMTSLRDDCISRTFGVAQHVTVVSLIDYIVPASNNLNSLFASGETESISIATNVETCCSEYSDDVTAKRFWPTFLRKTSCIKSGAEEIAVTNMQSYTSLKRRSIRKVTPEEAIVRRFNNCPKLPSTKPPSNPLPEFYLNVITHKLLRLWISHSNTLTML